MNKKMYYPRYYTSKKLEKEREEFRMFLNSIKNAAVSTESRWEQFYHYVTYTLPDGSVYEYMEDNDYMIPYSIEQLA